MDEITWKAVRANLFPAAWPFVEPWQSFPWHTGSNQRCDTDRPHSSQALAIDVFGTIGLSPSRDHILDALAERLGLPAGGTWQVSLEWQDRHNVLKERRQTQVDVLARSAKNLLFFECKFTERDGGACSQPNLLSSGARPGVRQCDGNYRLQTNPRNGVEARCALSGKGIRYWEVIPQVFDFESGQDYCPCPFAGPWFQWMRNLVNCYALAQGQALQPAFLLVYADGQGLHLAEQVHNNALDGLSKALKPGRVRFESLSFQQIMETAARTAPSEIVWAELVAWVERKVQQARQRSG